MNDLAVDTETLGLDLYHICKPFMVQMFDGTNSIYWEWDVNPIDRQPIIPENDKREIRDYLRRAKRLIFQNGKYDIQAIATIGIEYPESYYAKTHDTLFAAHLLGSAEKHDLTALALKHLRQNIQPLEDAVEAATKEARRIAKRDYKTWMIAKHGLLGMPSVKKGGSKDEDKIWKNDMWLPRAIAKEKKYPPNHPWWTVTRDYGTTDTIVTYHIFKDQLQQLEEMQNGLARSL